MQFSLLQFFKQLNHLVSRMLHFVFTAVKGIKKQHLVEVRTMGNPPPVIKLALESICLLLGQPVADWKEIRQILMKDTFITSIVNFDTDYIT